MDPRWRFTSQYTYEFAGRSFPVGAGHVQQPNRQNFPALLISAGGYVEQILSNDLKPAMLRVGRTQPNDVGPDDLLPLEDFTPLRSSIVWEFCNPADSSLPDSCHPHAVADDVGDFWTLVRDLEGKEGKQQELTVVQIGAGTLERCGLFLDKFKALDERRASHYYSKLRVILDASTQEAARPALREHVSRCRFAVLDPANLLESLPDLHRRVLHIDLTNVYSTLPYDELVRRDGRTFLVEVRAYLARTEATRITEKYGLPLEQARTKPEAAADFANAMRLEERMIPLEDAAGAISLPGMELAKLEDIVKGAPNDVRLPLSSNALVSFGNTLPLLHPRGYLQVYDTFATNLNQYRQGGDRVNGVLLREAGELAGYDVHFAPFEYREGSETSSLYASPRE